MIRTRADRDRYVTADAAAHGVAPRRVLLPARSADRGDIH